MLGAGCHVPQCAQSTAWRRSVLKKSIEAVVPDLVFGVAQRQAIKHFAFDLARHFFQGCRPDIPHVPSVLPGQSVRKADRRLHDSLDFCLILCFSPISGVPANESIGYGLVAEWTAKCQLIENEPVDG